MNNWTKMPIQKAILFNPAESIEKGTIAKKIPMGYLTEFQRKINNYELSRYSSGPKFRNEDTLVAKITPCIENGKTAYVDILDDDEVAFGSSEFIVLRKTKYTDDQFIFYLAISPTFRNRAISCMEGTSGRQRVNENTLKNFELPFPSVNEQSKIAKVLSDLDAKIELNNKINVELEAMAKLIYDYWFVQFDFPISADYAASVSKPDLQGKPYKSSGGKMVFNEELKREIPEGWEVGTLADLYKFQYGSGNTNPNNGGSYPIYGAGGVIGGYDKFNSEDAPVIGHMGAYCGAVIFAYGKHYVTYNGVICLVKDDYQKWFSYLSLLSKDLMSQTRGSSQPFVSYDMLYEVQTILPIKEASIRFDAVASKLFERINLSINENQKLAELRNWLLPMLMNGQVTVK